MKLVELHESQDQYKEESGKFVRWVIQKNAKRLKEMCLKEEDKPRHSIHEIEDQSLFLFPLMKIRRLFKSKCFEEALHDGFSVVAKRYPSLRFEYKMGDKKSHNWFLGMIVDILEVTVTGKRLEIMQCLYDIQYIVKEQCGDSSYIDRIFELNKRFI